MSYFFGDPSGLKRDIERHREKEAELRERIAELEVRTKDKDLNDRWDMDVRVLRTYRYFLANLLESKAQVTSQIGVKK